MKLHHSVKYLWGIFLAYLIVTIVLPLLSLVVRPSSLEVTGLLFLVVLIVTIIGAIWAIKKHSLLAHVFTPRKLPFIVSAAISLLFWSVAIFIFRNSDWVYTFNFKLVTNVSLAFILVVIQSAVFFYPFFLVCYFWYTKRKSLKSSEIVNLILFLLILNPVTILWAGVVETQKAYLNTHQPCGLEIMEVADGSTLKDKVEVGQVVTRINAEPVVTLADLQRVVGTLGPEEPVIVVTNNATHTAQLIFDPETQQRRLGLSVRPALCPKLL